MATKPLLPDAPKPRKLKLDPFQNQLEEMEEKKITLGKMQAWLLTQECEAKIPLISKTLRKWRRARYNASMLELINSGAQQHDLVKEAFKKNPAPSMEIIMKLHRVLIFHFSAKGGDNPDMAKLCDQLTKTVLSFMNDETRAQLKKRELTLAEAKVAEARKSDQLKALEGCMERLENFPDVKELFDKAFDVLQTKVEPV